MHMHIRYHFLDDLHVKRRAWNRKWKAYPEYPKQTCRVELVTSWNCDYRPQAISEHLFFYIPLRVHRRIFPGKAKQQWILLNLNISRSEKLHKVWITVKGSSRDSLFFQIYVTFSIDFPNNLYKIYDDYYFARQSYWFISQVTLVNDGNFSCTGPKCFSAVLFMFLWTLLFTKYDKIM